MKELLKNSCNIAADDSREVIVYDQCTQDATGLQTGTFLSVLLSKLADSYKSVLLLSGEFNLIIHKVRSCDQQLPDMIS